MAEIEQRYTSVPGEYPSRFVGNMGDEGNRSRIYLHVHVVIAIATE